MVYAYTTLHAQSIDDLSTLISISPSRSTGRGVDACREREPSVVLCCTLIMVLADISSAGHWNNTVQSTATARRNAQTAAAGIYWPHLF